MVGACYQTRSLHFYNRCTLFKINNMGVEKVKFNKKIKKGLKDGSICEIDGNYYEVKIEEAQTSSFVYAKITTPIMRR